MTEIEDCRRRDALADLPYATLHVFHGSVGVTAAQRAHDGWMAFGGVVQAMGEHAMHV